MDIREEREDRLRPAAEPDEDAGSKERSSAEGLVQEVYRELRTLATRYLKRERSGHTLQPTALVHEAYLALARQEDARWADPGQFYAIAATAMRRILVNHARDRGRLKRGGAERLLSVQEADVSEVPAESTVDLVALDEALERLGRVSPRKVELVQLRYFAGLTHEQCASVLGVSLAQVKREWALARAWLLRELTEEGAA